MDEFIDAVANDATADINTLIKREEFYEDIIITGTPNDMIFEGKPIRIKCVNNNKRFDPYFQEWNLAL